MINIQDIIPFMKDGTVFRGVGTKWIKEDCKLIAEYPTWQEAVNSKEFNG